MFNFRRLNKIERDIERLKKENAAQIELIRTLSREMARLKASNAELKLSQARVERASFFRDSIISSQSSS